MIDRARYPGLFDELELQWRDRLRMVFELEPPDPDLITNVRGGSWWRDTFVMGRKLFG